MNNISTTIKKKKMMTILMLSSFVVMLFSIVITRGETLECILHNNPTDTFMDHFKSIIAVKDLKPYEEGVIYPPLANAFYTVCRHLIPRKWVANQVVLRNSQFGLVMIVILLIITIFSLFYIIKGFSKKQEDGIYNDCFALCMIVSYPFLYAYERGNIILISLIFTLIFILWYDETSPIKKELALISLAVAAGIKIYPAVFGLMLIKERKWKDSLRCIFYGLLAFVVPCFLYGGPSSIIMLVKNIVGTTNMMTDQSLFGFGYKVNISNTVEMFNSVLNISIKSNVCTAIFAVMLVVSFVICGEKWAESLACSLICICLPGFNYVYVLTYLLIPILLFFNTENDNCNKRERIMWIILFVLSMAYIPSVSKMFSKQICSRVLYSIYLCNFIEMLIVIIMSLFLFEFCIRTKSKKA